MKSFISNGGRGVIVNLCAIVIGIDRKLMVTNEWVRPRREKDPPNPSFGKLQGKLFYG